MPDSYWPVAGTITNPYGAGQVRTAGMTGPLPDTNTGIDIGAPQGALVVAPVAGTVKSIFSTTHDDSKGQRDPNENYGYGGQVVITGDDGKEYRLSHAMYGSIRVKPGQRVAAGEQTHRVGQSGNATGSHVDFEMADSQGRIEDPTPFLDRSARMADTAQTREYARQRDEIDARITKNKADLAAAKKLIADYESDKKTPTADWLAARKLTPADLTAAYDATDPKSGLADTIAKDELESRRVNGQLARATDDASSTTPGSPYVNVDASDPVLIKRNPQTGQPLRNPDGSLQTEPNPAYRGPAPAARRTQVVGGNLIDLDTGKVIAALPADAKNRRTQVVGNKLIDLDNGAVVADLTEALAKAEKPEPITVGSTVYPRDPTTNLPIKDQGVDLATDAQRRQTEAAAVREELLTAAAKRRAENWARVQAVIAGGGSAADISAAATAAASDLTEYIASTGAQLQQRQQVELERHNKETEAAALRTADVNDSAERRQIGELADELEQRQLGTAKFFGMGGHPEVLAAAKNVPDRLPGETLGQAILRQMGVTGSNRTPLRGAAAAASPATAAAPAPATQPAQPAPGGATTDSSMADSPTARLLAPLYEQSGIQNAPIVPPASQPTIGGAPRQADTGRPQYDPYPGQQAPAAIPQPAELAAAIQANPPPATPAEKTPVPGKEAEDIGGGMARTTYSDGTTDEWAISGQQPAAGGMGGGLAPRGRNAPIYRYSGKRHPARRGSGRGAAA